MIGFPAMRRCRQQQNIWNGIAQNIRHFISTDCLVAAAHFVTLINDQEVELGVNNALQAKAVMGFHFLQAPPAPFFNRFQGIHGNNHLIVLAPEIDLVIGFHYGKGSGKGVDIIGIIHTKCFIEVLFQLLFPLQHGRFGDNDQHPFDNVSQLQLLHYQAGFDGLSHTDFIRQQKPDELPGHHFFKGQNLVWQGNNAAFKRRQNLLGGDLVSNPGSHCMKSNL